MKIRPPPKFPDVPVQKINAKMYTVRAAPWYAVERADVGVNRYGAVGGLSISQHNLLARSVVEHLCEETGASYIEARQWYFALGRIIQAMLIAGQPVGIPHVGVLHFQEYHLTPERMERKLRNRLKFADDVESGKEWKNLSPEIRKKSVHTLRNIAPRAVRRIVTLYQTRVMRSFFEMNGHYRGTLKQLKAVARMDDAARKGSKDPYIHIAVAAKEAAREALRGGVTNTGSKPIWMGRIRVDHNGKADIVDNNLPTAIPNKAQEKREKAARAGLMVEDANAAVRTDNDGAQRIVKVPSRAAEADRQGVDESSI